MDKITLEELFTELTNGENIEDYKDKKGCGKRFTHKFWGDRICGQFEDLKHSDHYIYCDECLTNNGDKQ